MEISVKYRGSEGEEKGKKRRSLKKQANCEKLMRRSGSESERSISQADIIVFPSDAFLYLAICL